METLAEPILTKHVYSWFAGATLALKECLCPRSSAYSSSNKRLSVPISGGWGPGDLASPCDWLARRCEKFTLEGAIWRISSPPHFQLNVECSALEGIWSVLCLHVCVYVHLHPLSFPHTELFLPRPRVQVRRDMKPAPGRPPHRFVPICVWCYDPKQQIIYRRILIRRIDTFCKSWNIPSSLFTSVRGVRMWLAPASPLPRVHRRRCGLLPKGPFGHETIVAGGKARKEKHVTRCRNLCRESSCSARKTQKHKY